jgi:hypothetical protein
MMGEVRGMLFVAQSTSPGMVREEQVPFTDLQGLLDACSAREEGTAFVKVEIAGVSAGEPRRLVLDFGQFGRDEG